MTETKKTEGSIAAFVERWRFSAAAERANKDSFLCDLCAALGVPPPEPSTGNPALDLYVFEKGVLIPREQGKPTLKRIDLYKHGCFTLEAKQGSEATTGKIGTAKRKTPAWNVAMNAAFGQALEYAQFLDQPPPFIIVSDIGYCFDLYATFDGSTNYRPFPNALAHRVYATDLEQRADTFRAIFQDPISLDPSRRAVEVTREVAGHLADLSRRLEKAGHGPQTVAAFLMRCIFTMFAEDVGLLPDRVFSDALRKYWVKSPKSFPGGIETLWRAMNEGTAFGFFGKLLHFNGGLFRMPSALPLSKEELAILLEAASCTWRDVEPAIFGALFEGALDKKERHTLGAHFTPRAYVERLIRPALEEPLRDDWKIAQERVRELVEANKLGAAKAVVRAFQKQLSKTRVLDPACGSGNFLYVALDVMKRIEDEAFSLLLALENGQMALCVDSPEVTPKQFLGIEINPRAKEITELVLWIGYLQWHFKMKHRGGKPREPVLENHKNIERADAVLGYDSSELRRDAQGKVVSRWDGETMKSHPVTGEPVPDERFTTPLYDYLNPRKPSWPKVDFIVGNPPYIGARRIRTTLGDGYVDALRAAYPELPDTADLVMYWWHLAASALENSRADRFGFLTTNSIVQEYSRPVVDLHFGKGVQLCFAIPDHPWVESTDGAAVRVAMTVAVRTSGSPPVGPVLGRVTHEAAADGRVDVDLRQVSVINSSLTAGPGVHAGGPLLSNQGLCFQGVVPAGDGFKMSAEDVRAAGYDLDRLPSVVRPYIIGRDLVQRTEPRYIVDFFGFTQERARSEHPALYQRLVDMVLPERRHNKRAVYKQRWWIFAEPRPALRTALKGLPRFIVTPYTAKFRPFIFAEPATLPDAMAYAIASDDAFILGVLSSIAHVSWAFAAGGRLGVGNDPRYTSNTTFSPFPFPIAADATRQRIRDLAEELDVHRKRQQALHSELTLTGMYNVLAKLRDGEALSAKEKTIHAQGLVSVLKQLHDDLDAAVFDAYGWAHDLSVEQILEQLIALNAMRAEEERRVVRWLRPEFQTEAPPSGQKATEKRGPGIAKTSPPKGPGIAAARARAAKPAKRRRGPALNAALSKMRSS